MALVLSGCSTQSPFINVQPERAGFVITKPPMKIIYRGDVSKDSQEFALRILREMNKVEFHDYKFNENTNIRLNSIDAKSDEVNIDLHEKQVKEICKVLVRTNKTWDNDIMLLSDGKIIYYIKS